MGGSIFARMFSAGLALAICLAAAESVLARVEVEAIPGRPFGVGRVTAYVPAGAEADAVFDASGFAVVEQNGRVLYPTFTTGVLRRLLDDLVGRGGAAPGSITALFLFTGDAPLNLTVYTPTATSVRVQPRPQPPRVYQRLLNRWWREYHVAARDQVRDGDYPPLVETYLTTMLGQRLGLRPPLLGRLQERDADQAQQTLELLLGVEQLRTGIMQDTLLGRSEVVGVADQPVPPGVAWPPLAVPPPAADVQIEPLAMRVPEECFYVRFGRFSNYLWFSQLMDQYGGEIRNMVTLRGYDAELNARLQQQLVLQQTALAEVLGDAVIADVALIGRDLYLNDGAAVGMLFLARSDVLGEDFRRQRQQALLRGRDQGVTLEVVQIGGRDVSLLSTPDNRLRSFYVADGHHHLITTSRALVERFLETVEGDGEGSLGASVEFQHARTTMPLNRRDTVFVYFSSAFFHGLVSPQYQIELARRLQASIDIELVHLARLAARAENRPAESLADLVRGGLLPPEFGRRADGSQPVLEGERVGDSLRGGRGSFTPVPDVELHGVTRAEAARYAARTAFYQENWRQMDPLLIGIRRELQEEKGRERLVVDAHVSPLDETKYGWLISMLGPPTTQQISAAPGDIISAQAVLRGGQFDPTIPPHHLFLGVQDTVPRSDLRPTGLLKSLKVLQTTPGYLGSWPKLGLLDSLPLGLGGGVADPHGYSALPLGLWRRQWDNFSLLSFDRQLLAQLPPHLAVEQAEEPAQLRLRVGDLSQAQLHGWINALNYERARQASVGNAKLLHTVSQQLGVPRQQALETTEALLNVKLVCTLGGEYQLVEHPGGLRTWQSTRWTASPVELLPEDYQAPMLEWFRGLNGRLTKYEDRVVLHAQLDMQRRPTEPRFELPPLFDLFGGRRRAADEPAPQEQPAPQDLPPPPPRP